MKQRESIENNLMDFLLKDIVFKIDDKVIKQGKLVLVNIKQFFIKFNIQIDNSIKVYELPYPFKITKTENRCTLDYCLSSLTGGTQYIDSSIKSFKTIQKPLKYYNNCIEILIS